MSARWLRYSWIRCISTTSRLRSCHFTHTWVYLELVQKTDSLDQSHYDAGKAKYKKTCLYIDPKKNMITRLISMVSFARGRDRDQIDVADVDANKMRSQNKVFRSITDAVMPLKKGFFRYGPIYNRAGTLVQVEGVGYLVISAWPVAQTNMPDGQYPNWLESVYLNPQNMCYLAVSEGIDLAETPSYMQKLQAHIFEVLTCTRTHSLYLARTHPCIATPILLATLM